MLTEDSSYNPTQVAFASDAVICLSATRNTVMSCALGVSPTRAASVLAVRPDVTILLPQPPPGWWATVECRESVAGLRLRGYRVVDPDEQETRSMRDLDLHQGWSCPAPGRVRAVLEPALAAIDQQGRVVGRSA